MLHGERIGGRVLAAEEDSVNQPKGDEDEDDGGAPVLIAGQQSDQKRYDAKTAHGNHGCAFSAQGVGKMAEYEGTQRPADQCRCEDHRRRDGSRGWIERVRDEIGYRRGERDHRQEDVVVVDKEPYERSPYGPFCLWGQLLFLLISNLRLSACHIHCVPPLTANLIELPRYICEATWLAESEKCFPSFDAA
jgi:hypothetical protein